MPAMITVAADAHHRGDHEAAADGAGRGGVVAGADADAHQWNEALQHPDRGYEQQQADAADQAAAGELIDAETSRSCSLSRTGSRSEAAG